MPREVDEIIVDGWLVRENVVLAALAIEHAAILCTNGRDVLLFLASKSSFHSNSFRAFRAERK